MKKLEKEELLKVIGILAEAEGYDLLTMNKYGSNPSSIAVLCGETGVEYAPVDMDAVVGEYTAGKMDIADIYKSLKNELPSDLQLKFPERQMREYQQTQYRQPVKPAGPVCVEISDADIEKLLEHPEAAAPVRSANQSVQALEDELDKEIQKSEEALRGPKTDKPANPLPVVTKEPANLSLDDGPETKVENNLEETPADSSPAPAESATPQAASEEMPKKLEIPEPPKSSLKDVMSLMLGNQNSGVPGKPDEDFDL